MMSLGSTGLFAFITFCMVITLISATPVIAVNSVSDDIIGQLINKRNSWWSKKSSLPLLRQFSGEIYADDAFCGKMMSFFNVIKADTSIEILAIFRHYFKLGLKVAEAARRIREVEGNETISGRTARNWFKCFKECYIYGCVDKLATCARESGMSGRGDNACQLELRMCGLKCVTDPSSFDN